jgi:hypothetical protein
MGYATVEFYKNTYHGNSIPDAELTSMLDKASNDVDRITRMKIKRLGGFSQLSEFEQLNVQLAVCSQADHLHLKSSLHGVSSYSIGDVSVNLEKAVDDYDKGCVAYLSSTRLLYRGL